MRIAILDDYLNVSRQLADWSRLGSGHEVVVFNHHLPSLSDRVRLLRDFDVLCMMRERMDCPAELIEALPALKLICITGQKHRTLDLPAAARRGVVVCRTQRRDSGSHATVELAWGLLLALARRLPHEACGMREGRWQTALGVSLEGKTLGLLGLGKLGQRMVPMARAFGMKVVAWSPNLTPERAEAAGTVWVDRQALFSQSDFLSLHLVLSDSTRHVVDERALALMRPDSYLVNTARAGLVDTEALLAALARGQLAGAAVDVFDEEPLPADAPIRRANNLILTPHIGYSVQELMREFYQDTVENIAAYLRGEPINVVV